MYVYVLFKKMIVYFKMSPFTVGAVLQSIPWVKHIKICPFGNSVVYKSKLSKLKKNFLEM